MKKSKLTDYIIMLPAFLYVSVFLSFTLFMMIAQSFGLFSLLGESGGFTFQYWKSAMIQESFDSFFYSLKIGLISSTLVVIIAYPIALMLNQEIKGARIVGSLIKIPYFINAMVAAFLIINIIAYHGFLNQILMFLGFIDKPLRMRNDNFGMGVIVIQIWKNIPFALLIITASIAGVSKDVIDAAKDLRAGPFRIFFSIYLPLTISGAVTAQILLFIMIFGDFAIYSVAGPIYPQSLTARMQLIVSNFLQWEEASVLAAILIAAVIIVASTLTFISKKYISIYERAGYAETEKN